MGRIAETLKDAVKKLAYSTSLEQLRKRGVDRVNVLGVDRIAFLIHEAVSRSLRYKMLALDREQLASATRDEFLQLLKSNETLSRSHDELRRMRDKAEEQVDKLRRDLTEQRGQLKKKLALAERNARARFDGEDAAIVGQIEALFADVEFATDADVAELQSRVTTLVMSIVTEERREVIAAREAVRNRDVDLLQRRISKLKTSLEETERNMREVTRLKNIDQGISSIYREVQGLDDNDDRYERKLELMSNIFEANRLLQKGEMAS